jgi:hypothetical protein
MIVRAEWISTAFRTFLGIGVERPVRNKMWKEMVKLDKDFQPT